MPTSASSVNPAASTSAASCSGRWKNAVVNQPGRPSGLRCSPARRSWLDDRLEAGLVELRVADAVDRRGEVRDGGGEGHAAGAEHAPRLAQCAVAVGGLWQVVERAE